MDKKSKIFIVASYNAAYILRDIELLRKYYYVKIIGCNDNHKNAINIFRTIIEITKGVCWSDVSYIWFADFRAFVTVLFAKILRKKTILVVGGYEVAYVPKIYYGGTLGKYLKKKISWIIHNTDVVLSVSKASRKELQKYYDFHFSKLIYNGVETQKFDVDPKIGKEDIAITVGYVTKSNLLRKGIEPFVKAAAYLPEIPFYIIGKYDEKTYNYLKKIASPNVVFTGFISEEELIKFYQKAKVYVQVSAHEAFGISLAEAMLCECVPVVTDRGALPEVVGNNGFYVPFNDPEETAKAIKKAMQSDKGFEARRHILENFSMKKRENALVKIIHKTLCK